MTLTTGSPFADHMVVQRDVPVTVWGTADAGAEVAVVLGDARAMSTAGDDGAWRVELPASPAGGPHALVISCGGERREIADVLVGEVWVCSGQSNMGFSLNGALNAEAEIAAAEYPQIRMFSVPNTPKPEPAAECGGRWHVCSPTNAHGFSAVGYFFARELHRKLGVPVGMLNSSVGGTPCEAWTPLHALESDSDFAMYVATAKKFRESGPEEDVGPYDDPGVQECARGWEADEVATDDWKPMDLPRMWQSEGLEFNGAVWFRREIELPADWEGHDLELSLDAIDDFDTTYVNGTRVGATGPETAGWWMAPRKYVVPADVVRAGRNTIAIRVFDQWCNGGFAGQPSRMALRRADGEGEPIKLAGPWRYKVELELPWRSTTTGTPATSLFNGMIAPLVPYTIKGWIWYQGESNADRAYQYRALFRTMIRAWRAAWGAELPFLFVQLANHTAPPEEPGDSAWAELREAQAMALAEPKTAMAVAIDVGEADDIHPRNKQDVGLRLGLAAEERVYGLDVVGSGPTFAGFAVEGDRVRISYEYVGGGLVARDGALKGFEIAGEDRTFVWADAAIDGDAVVVRSEKVSAPVAVRYAWANNPVCNLYNKDGLPAVPFRTDDW